MQKQKYLIMQRQDKKRYIQFDPDEDPELIALGVSNHITKTVEQQEDEEAKLLADIKANSIPDEYKEIYAAEIAHVTKVFLQRYPKTKKSDFEFSLHGILQYAWNSTQHPTAKKEAVMAALRNILNE